MSQSRSQPRVSRTRNTPRWSSQSTISKHRTQTELKVFTGTMRIAVRRITGKTPASDIAEPSVRYADDMVIILRPEDDAIEILDRISRVPTQNAE